MKPSRIQKRCVTLYRQRSHSNLAKSRHLLTSHALVARRPRSRTFPTTEVFVAVIAYDGDVDFAGAEEVSTEEAFPVTQPDAPHCRDRKSCQTVRNSQPNNQLLLDVNDVLAVVVARPILEQSYVGSGTDQLKVGLSRTGWSSIFVLQRGVDTVESWRELSRDVETSFFAVAGDKTISVETGWIPNQTDT
jgi:hypothetical protein